MTSTTVLTLAVELALTYTIHKIQFQAIFDAGICLRFVAKEFFPLAREGACPVKYSPAPQLLLLLLQVLLLLLLLEPLASQTLHFALLVPVASVL